MNPDEIIIRIMIDDPCAREPQQVWLNVNRHLFHDAFAPLPRDSELIFLPEARVRELAQRQARAQAASIIAEQLAPAIVEAMGKIDTINGYTRREWGEMHR